MAMLPLLVALATIAGLPLTLSSLKHETLVLGNRLSGRAHIRMVDGITIMSEEYYTDPKLAQMVIITPRDRNLYLMVQFEYLDIAQSSPCQDSIKICEVATRKTHITHLCRAEMVDKFCGKLDQLFPSGLLGTRRVYKTTTHWGQGLRIDWETGRPRGEHRGFKLVITAFATRDSCGNSMWRCGDGKCISRDLHCDGVVHCLDSTDETINCSNMLDDTSPVRNECGSRGSDLKVCLPGWSEHWLALIIPLVVVIILVIIFISVKLRQQIIRLRNLAPQSRAAVTCPHHHTCVHHQQQPHHHQQQQHPHPQQQHLCPQQPALPADPAVRPVPSAPAMGEVETFSDDPTTLTVLLPPPYTTHDHHNTAPGGDPPPLYEDPRALQEQCLCHKEGQLPSC